MAVGLLLSAFAKSYSKEELYLQQKFKERLADLHATVGKVSFSTCLIMTHGGIKFKMPDRRISIRVIYFTVTLSSMNIPQIKQISPSSGRPFK